MVEGKFSGVTIQIYSDSLWSGVDRKWVLRLWVQVKTLRGGGQKPETIWYTNIQLVTGGEGLIEGDAQPPGCLNSAPFTFERNLPVVTSRGETRFPSERSFTGDFFQTSFLKHCCCRLPSFRDSDVDVVYCDKCDIFCWKQQRGERGQSDRWVQVRMTGNVSGFFLLPSSAWSLEVVLTWLH